MEVLKILKIGEGRLREKSKEIKGIDDEVRTLIADMMETLKAAEGVGLAAPQVGKNVCLVIYQTPEVMQIPEALINPRIISHRMEEMVGIEGCLSVPEERREVSRFKKIRVEYTDSEGKTRLKRAVDLEARIIQHELDHLDGILFVDRMREEDKRELRDKYGANNIK